MAMHCVHTWVHVRTRGLLGGVDTTEAIGVLALKVPVRCCSAPVRTLRSHACEPFQSAAWKGGLALGCAACLVGSAHYMSLGRWRPLEPCSESGREVTCWTIATTWYLSLLRACLCEHIARASHLMFGCEVWVQADCHVSQCTRHTLPLQWFPWFRCE
jgi:hypothetical protein